MRHPFDSHTGPATAGLLVVASSAYTLLTADPATLTFRIHVALLVGVAVVALVGIARRRE